MYSKNQDQHIVGIRDKDSIFVSDKSMKTPHLDDFYIYPSYPPHVSILLT